MIRRAVLSLVFLVGAMLHPASVQGHARSISYSSWDLLPDGARVRVRLTQLELTRLPVAPGRLRDPAFVGTYLSGRLVLRSGGVPCPVIRAPIPLRSTKGWMSFEWRVRCSGDGPREIESTILLDEAPSHLHFARLTTGGLEEQVLTQATPRWSLPGGEAAEDAPLGGASLAGYVKLGVEHILSGWDHLAFVLALLLLAGTLGEVATLVTAFTLAHSVTLALGVLGLLHPEAAAIEALIGFSITLVALENGWLLGGRGRLLPAAVTLGLLILGVVALLGWGTVSPTTLGGLALFSACHFALLSKVERPARLRAALAFCFGLIHGFGFAGVLAEIGLPAMRRVPALFGFNLGVELGQLAVVALVWPLLRMLARPATQQWHRRLAETGSAIVCGLGLFWFATRLYG